MATRSLPHYWKRSWGEGIEHDNSVVERGIQHAEEYWDGIVELSPGFWLIPKASGPGCYQLNDHEERYKCDCPYTTATIQDRRCKHYYAMLHKRSLTTRCAVCQRRYRTREMFEIHDCEHPALYPGNRVCPSCAVREGVA